MNNRYVRNNIKRYREYKGISQEELAGKLGITQAYLSKLENQKFMPGPILVVKICAYLDVEIGKMFYVDQV